MGNHGHRCCQELSNQINNATIRESRASARLLEIEEDLFDQSSRYLVLFLTLRYKDERSEDITLKTIQKHRNAFLDRVGDARDDVLSKIQACIWKLEEGRSSGLHLHCLIFFTGRHRADTYFAEQIGEYWVDRITRGWGDYWNSNTAEQKARYERKHGNCLGQVNAGDEAKRASLRRFVSEYFAKQTQVPADRGQRDRTWGIRVYREARQS
jgi:hypothetical protein